MSFPDPVPQRLSDAERDVVVAALRVHFEAGRLDADEFTERMNTALAAKTAAEVIPLFADLPGPHPAVVTSNQPTWNTYPGTHTAPYAGDEQRPGATATPDAPATPWTFAESSPSSSALVPYQGGRPPVPAQQSAQWMNIAQALIWPVAILLMIFGHGGFWVIILAIIATSALGAYRRNHRRTPPPY